MFIQFISRANPYITTTNKELFRVLKNFYCEQISEQTFNIEGRAQVLSVRPLSPYEKNKAALRNIAQEWQYNFPKFAYSWEQLAGWQDFFTEYGKKYGLLTEFQENGIC
jgi:hypothetical protein